MIPTNTECKTPVVLHCDKAASGEDKLLAVFLNNPQYVSMFFISVGFGFLGFFLNDATEELHLLAHASDQGFTNVCIELELCRKPFTDEIGNRSFTC